MNRHRIRLPLISFCQEIYKKGGRKFGFIGMAPLGCLPSMRAMKPGDTGTCVEEFNTLLKLHNRVLDKVLLKLKGHLTGFKYSYPNFYHHINEIFNNPSKYGKVTSTKVSISLFLVS